MSADLLKGKVLTGYHREDTFIATRKFMGGRPVFHLDMCIAQLTAGVDAPPVGVAQEDDQLLRRVADDYFVTTSIQIKSGRAQVFYCGAQSAFLTLKHFQISMHSLMTPL